jgi:predicted small metal-binding protein
MANTVLHCDCGFEASAADEGDLVAEVQRHAWEAHGMALSRDDALLLASRAEDGEAVHDSSPEVMFRAELRENAPPAVSPGHTTEGGTT